MSVSANRRLAMQVAARLNGARPSLDTYTLIRVRLPNGGIRVYRYPWDSRFAMRFIREFPEHIVDSESFFRGVLVGRYTPSEGYVDV